MSRSFQNNISWPVISNLINPSMSCENCNRKLNFLKKRECGRCGLLFCSQCNWPQKGSRHSNVVVSLFSDRKLKCYKCQVLTARPLNRIDLQKLKAKDLQDYLNTQHVSTHGCVEKEELVNLLLQHVSNSGNGGPPNRTGFHSQTNLHSPDYPRQEYSFQTYSPQTTRTSQSQETPTFSFNRVSEQRDSSQTESIPQSSNSNPQNISDHEGIAVASEEMAAPIVIMPNDESSNQEEDEDWTKIDWTKIEIQELDTWGNETDEGPSPTIVHAEDTEDTAGAFEEVAHIDPPFVEELTPVDEDPGFFGERKDESPKVNPNLIQLSDIKTQEDLERLTVKQLKELLTINRMDFRGCCEKTELVDRAMRLWKQDIINKKVLENLSLDDLCKICMDAPVECVMLECGHMATCTACGKKLCECPICRQYVVRVVRTFRA